jgi:hypothetical protein
MVPKNAHAWKILEAQGVRLCAAAAQMLPVPFERSVRIDAAEL